MSQVDDALHGKLKQGRKTNKKLRRQVRVLIRSRQEILEGAVAAKTLLYGPPRFPIAVIENMAKHLTPSASYRTLAHLGTASRELYEKIKPILYRRVLWDSNTKWRRMFPCAKKRFRPRVIPAGWQYTKQLIVKASIWDLIRSTSARLFPHLDIVIIKHESRSNVCFCHSPSSASLNPDQILERHDFICDLIIRNPVDADVLVSLLVPPLRWSCGDRLLLHSINTVANVHVAVDGLVTSLSGFQNAWMPPVSHQLFQLTCDALQPSDGLLQTMRYFCAMIRPANRWVEHIGGGPADCTLRFSLPGGLDVYSFVCSVAGRDPIPKPHNQNLRRPWAPTFAHTVR